MYTLKLTYEGLLLFNFCFNLIGHIVLICIPRVLIIFEAADFSLILVCIVFETFLY